MCSAAQVACYIGQQMSCRGYVDSLGTQRYFKLFSVIPILLPVYINGNYSLCVIPVLSPVYINGNYCLCVIPILSPLSMNGNNCLTVIPVLSPFYTKGNYSL